MKLTKILIISTLIFLILAFAFTETKPAHADEPVSATTNSIWAIRWQRKTFYATNRFWLFYTNGTSFISTEDSYAFMGVTWVYQTFKVGGTAHSFNKISFRGSRTGTPNNVTVSIRAVNATTGEPTGSDLTSGYTDANGWSTAIEWHNITVELYSLSANTQYAIIFRAPNAASSSWINQRCSIWAGYDDGKRAISTNSGATWNTASEDIDAFFRIYYANALWEKWDTSVVSATYYVTSVDGITWTTPTFVRQTQYYFGEAMNAFYQDGYVYVTIKDINLYYRRGVPNSDGTISWSYDWQLAYQQPSWVRAWADHDTGVDSEGYPYVLWALSNSTNLANLRIWISKSMYNDGRWVTAEGYPMQMNTVWSGSGGLLVTLPNQKMYAIWAKGNEHLRGRLYNGTDWSEEEQVSVSNIYDSYDIGKESWSYSAIPIDNDIHLIFNSASPEYNVIYCKRTWGSGWGSETVLAYDTAAFASPVMTKDEATDNLYAFWCDSPNNIWTKKWTYSTNSWESTLLYVNASAYGSGFPHNAEYGLDGLLSVSRTVTESGYVGLAFMTNDTGSSCLFNIRYSAKPEVTVTIAQPQNTTYTSGTIPIQIMASGGTIDRIWYNIKSGGSWLYSNTTYTAPTTKTLTNGIYTFYGWANNTDGNSDSKTVVFTVNISTTPPPPSAGFNLYFETNGKLAFQHLSVPWETKAATITLTVTSGTLNGTSGSLAMYPTSGTLRFTALENGAITLTSTSNTTTTFHVNGEVATSASLVNGQSYTIEWSFLEPEFLLPIMFILGMFGLGSMFGGPIYGIYKVKHGEYLKDSKPA